MAAPATASQEIFALQPFVSGVGTVAVVLTRSLQTWQLDYHLDSGGEPLEWAPPVASDGGRRVEGLWRESCCELFIVAATSTPGDSPYLEFNFSPAGDWAAFAFDGPRRGMRAHVWSGAEPLIERQPTAEGFVLSVQLPIAALMTSPTVVPPLAPTLLAPSPTPLTGWSAARVAFSVVMKTRGTVSYWALRHPGPQPDFHDPEGFIALPTVSSP